MRFNEFFFYARTLNGALINLKSKLLKISAIYRCGSAVEKPYQKAICDHWPYMAF